MNSPNLPVDQGDDDELGRTMVLSFPKGGWDMKGELNNKEVDRPSHGVHDRKRNLLRNVVKGELPRKTTLVVANGERHS